MVRNYKFFALIASFIVLVSCSKRDNKTLKLYCGAGLRVAVDELIAEFTKDTGVSIEPDYGGSGVIIVRAEENKDGDLFMPGSVSYVNDLQDAAGIVDEKFMTSYFVPVIVVQKGNPKNIKTIKDFERKDIAVALGNPKACQIGKLTSKMFKKNNINADYANAKQSMTVNELGVWVKMKDVDASIVWDAIAENVKESVDIIQIPKDENIISKVAVAVLKTSKNKKSAMQFAQYLLSEKAQKIFKKNGYRTSLPK